MYARLFHSEAAAPTRANLVSLILRVVLAVIFLFHGLDKIVRHDGGTTWVNAMYARMPAQPSAKPEADRAQIELIPESMTFLGTQLAVSWGEFLGGLALLAGMLTRLASLGLILIQIGAVVLVTAPRGFALDVGGGSEYNLALIAMCLSLVVLGAGSWSVDAQLLEQRRKASHARTHPATLPVAGPHGTPTESAESLTPGAAS
jgi:uncharacterized membrane protein YphA (DoxX/SURF4 family)